MGYNNLTSNQYISLNNLKDAFDTFKLYPSNNVLPTLTNRFVTKTQISSWVDSLIFKQQGTDKGNNQFVTKDDFLEQSLQFTPVSKFRSPVLLYYYKKDDIDYLYICDADDGYVSGGSTSNFYRITITDLKNSFNNNNEFTRTNISYLGNIKEYSYTNAIDSQYHRLYSCGYDPNKTSNDNTVGLNVYDIASNTLKTIPFGLNGSSTDFFKLSINILNSEIIVSSNTTLYTIPRATIMDSGTVATIITAQLYNTNPIATKGCIIKSLDDTYFVIVSSNQGVTLDTGLGIFKKSGNNFVTVTTEEFTNRYIPSSANGAGLTFKSAIPQSFGYNNYQRGLYFDTITKKLFLFDLGGKTITVFQYDNTTNVLKPSLTKIGQCDLSDDLINTYLSGGFVVNESNNDLLLSGRVSVHVNSNNNGTTDTFRTYTINKNCTNNSDIIINLDNYYSVAFNQLIKGISSERYLYGCLPGGINWSSNIPTATDGIINIYGKLS